MAVSDTDEPTPPRESVSACLITLDEEDRLPGALASVSFCDEIVVVDSGSSDRTAEIARAAGARVVENPWPGFARQRNVAIDHATSDWILEVDADERVSPPLRAEIEAFLRDPPPELDMGALPLRDRFLGRELGPAAKYPKYRYRLFRRGAYRHDERRVVHEGLWAARRVRAFTGDIEHELAASWREAIRDAWNYARLDAEHGDDPGGMPGFLGGVVLRPLVKFAYRALVLGGWRDSWRGLAKIGLDCISDSIVAVRRRRLGPRASAPSMWETAFAGTPRLAAVATGATFAQAESWLGEARAAGADAVLVTSAPGARRDQDTHPVRRLGPAALNRALDAEHQLRALDAVVPFGPVARGACRMLPTGLKGPVGVVAPGSGPGDVLAAIAGTRTERGEERDSR